jgi:hypothetical protein
LTEELIHMTRPTDEQISAHEHEIIDPFVDKLIQIIHVEHNTDKEDIYKILEDLYNEASDDGYNLAVTYG